MLWFFFSAFIKIERRDLVSEIRFAGENENLSTGRYSANRSFEGLTFSNVDSAGKLLHKTELIPTDSITSSIVFVPYEETIKVVVSLGEKRSE